MTDTEERQLYDSMVSLAAKNIPGFEIRFKNEHFLQKVIAVLVFVFNPKYMTRFTTTAFPRVYFPSREWLKEEGYLRAFKILAHEYVHLWDEQNQGHFRFKRRYGNPQWFALLAPLAFFAFLWTPALWALCALVFAAPWPSPGRRDLERRGYLMSIAVNYWRYGSVKDEQIESVIGMFTGWAYYLMWPFKSIRGLIKGDIAGLKNGTVYLSHTGTPYAQVLELLDEHGLLVP